jgi:small subunit ribosomal protein S1
MPARTPPAEAAAIAPLSERLAELEALAGSGLVDMAELLGAAPLATARPKSGAKVRGTVTSIGHDELQIDLGARASGFLHRREAPDARVGDTVEAYVVRADDLGVQLSVRLSGAAAADHLADAADAQIPVEGVVQTRNAGGYEVRIGNARAFCPVSQIARVPLADPDSVLGQTLTFLIVDAGDKLVVSRRRLEERELGELRKGFWGQAKVGDVREATVTGVIPVRAFLDLDGADATMPKNEYGWENPGDLTTRLQRGQRLMVRIVELDPEKQSIVVSTKDPTLDPWKLASTQLQAGTTRSARVVSHAPFGAFLELLPGLQGLLHASRLGGASLPEVGAHLDVQVVKIDLDARRIELAMPGWEPRQGGASVPEPAPFEGGEVEGLVESVIPGGVRVRLADGRSAFLPEREVPLAPGQMLSHRFRAGHPVKARLTQDERGRPMLSQREDTSAQDAAWRQVAAQQSSQSMGTLGDLFKARAKR